MCSDIFYSASSSTAVCLKRQMNNGIYGQLYSIFMWMYKLLPKPNACLTNLFCIWYGIVYSGRP